MAKKIIGRWQEGYALDLHTVSSTFLGYDQYGHEQFDTVRSDIGELLYKLKNKNDESTIDSIVNAIENLMTKWSPEVEVIVPVPPSAIRPRQPLILLTQEVSKRLGLPVADCITRTRKEPQLKNVWGLDERLQLLDGLHTVDEGILEGKKVLLFDDLYRSGATMNAITTLLYKKAGATNVFALTVTKTRSHQ